MTLDESCIGLGPDHFLRFEIGSEPPTENLPSFEEIRSSLEMVHARAISTLRGLSRADLDSENASDLAFRSGNSKRAVVRHAIRHEPSHIGQIGWLIKLSGGETV